MREFQHTVTTADGVKLFVRESLPAAAVATRSLLFVHGACEHGGRYAELSRAATNAGWRVLIPDQRGHGQSTGQRVFIRHFDQYLDDLRLLCRHFSLDPLRTAIVGHSLGGLVVARLLQTPGDLAVAACLLSPYMGLQIKVDRFTLMLGKILERVWPTYRFRSRVKSADLARNPEYLERRRLDPLIQRFVTARWFFAVQHAVRQAHADARLLRIPVLVLQGEQDHIVNPQATRDWLKRVGSTDRTLHMLPEHLHELLQETDREDTTRFVLDWLDERVR